MCIIEKGTSEVCALTKISNNERNKVHLAGMGEIKFEKLRKARYPYENFNKRALCYTGDA